VWARYLPRVLGPFASRSLAAASALAMVGLLASATLGETSQPATPPEARTADAGPGAHVRFVTLYDSHGLTPFGDRLDAILLSIPGSELTSYTLGGASPSWLLRRAVSPRGYVFDSADGKALVPRSRLLPRDVRTPALDALLRVPAGAYERQVVILILGSNVPGAPAVHTAPVEQIVRSIHTRPDTVCIWVGPPDIRSWSSGYSDEVYAAIRAGIQAAEPDRSRGPACHLIDSRRLSAYPAGGDGTHYGFNPAAAAAAHHWADGVGQEIDRILRGLPLQRGVAGAAPPARSP
jgi:hypothetical protein